MGKIILVAIWLMAAPVLGFAATDDQDLSFQRVDNVVLVSQDGKVIEMINDVPQELSLRMAYRIKHGKKGESWTIKKVEVDLLPGLPLKQATEATEITYSYRNGHFVAEAKEPQRLEQSEWFITGMIVASVFTLLLFSAFCETVMALLICGATNCVVWAYLLTNLSFWGEQALMSGMTILLEADGLALALRLVIFLWPKQRKVIEAE